jgi:hypothetical protein
MLNLRGRPHMHRTADGSTLVRWWDAGSRLRATHPDALRLVAFIVNLSDQPVIGYGSLRAGETGFRHEK